jgi:hypothetical protein
MRDGSVGQYPSIYGSLIVAGEHTKRLKLKWKESLLLPIFIS